MCIVLHFDTHSTEPRQMDTLPVTLSIVPAIIQYFDLVLRILSTLFRQSGKLPERPMSSSVGGGISWPRDIKLKDCGPLEEEHQSQLSDVVRTCEEVVLHTSPRSMSSSPTVSFHGCSISSAQNTSRPAVVIVCSSANYLATLRKRLGKSSISSRDGTKFEVITVADKFTSQNSRGRARSGRIWKSRADPPDIEWQDTERQDTEREDMESLGTVSEFEVFELLSRDMQRDDSNGGGATRT
ncbi:hypothetical protein F5Y01DRAFT_290081 [Xylaria sp. FL0043]|nr:hypothetical protein F5Y01DRAFT_290081 [Xylaria sp. FL0043]